MLQLTTPKYKEPPEATKMATVCPNCEAYTDFCLDSVKKCTTCSFPFIEGRDWSKS